MKTPLNLNEMKGYQVSATDGPVGTVKDFFFDDRTWKIKYVDVHTSSRSGKRDVLITPESLEKPGQWTSSIRLTITRDQVDKSPGADSDMPVSRQHKVARQSDVFFSWGGSFIGTHNIGPSNYDFSAKNKGGREWDPDLFSMRSVTGFRVHSKDGTSGHVRDFIIDNDTWTIHFLVVETGNIFNNREVLIPVKDITAINDDAHAVVTDLSKIKVQESPAYDPWGEYYPFDQRKDAIDE